MNFRIEFNLRYVVEVISLSSPLFTFPNLYYLVMIMPGLPSTEFEIPFHLHYHQSGIWNDLNEWIEL